MLELPDLPEFLESPLEHASLINGQLRIPFVRRNIRRDHVLGCFAFHDCSLGFHLDRTIVKMLEQLVHLDLMAEFVHDHCIFAIISVPSPSSAFRPFHVVSIRIFVPSPVALPSSGFLAIGDDHLRTSVPMLLVSIINASASSGISDDHIREVLAEIFPVPVFFHRFFELNQAIPCIPISLILLDAKFIDVSAFLPRLLLRA